MDLVGNITLQMVNNTAAAFGQLQRAVEPLLPAPDLGQVLDDVR